MNTISKIKFIFVFSFLLLQQTYALDFSQKAFWITADNKNANQPNTWIAFRKDFTLENIPKEAIASIGADSKYWLWLNGNLVVFEGSLKRGPSPQDSYYDSVNLQPFLKKGNNRLALLLCYFGKTGFSHIDSGKSGVLFSSNQIGLFSDSTWKSMILDAYGVCGNPVPNWRLSESSIKYDGRKDIGNWHDGIIPDMFVPSIMIGQSGSAPWNKLIKRPIPLWKDFGLKKVAYTIHSGEQTDTLVARLPYNMQFTPHITLDDPVGNHLIKLESNHLYGGSECGVRAEYITRKGLQSYESLGWINGEIMYVIVPKGLEIKQIKYRQTGYDAENEGSFICDDAFVNRFWNKAIHTLYVNMRDTYFDCPDRERAQWWGDVTVLMGECFYTYSKSVHHLMRKGILELCAFQRPSDNCLHSPIPGNYDEELPAQMLASIGLYGFWNYYMNTGDFETIKIAYPHVRDYLNVWNIDETGLTAERHGGWDWGDWGENRDIRLIYAGWHYIALDAAAKMADLLEHPLEANHYRYLMNEIKKGYNACWNGSEYRHPSYKGQTDDRVQALAVLSGIATKDKYPVITAFLKSNRHASPYMEKYVMESLFVMNEGAYAMQRYKERFHEMVVDPIHTTLYEGWGIAANGFGGGTTNHAWSGGPLTVISQYLMGISPTEPGWKTFNIKPQIVALNKASIEVPTVKGLVKMSFKKNKSCITYKITVPNNSSCNFYPTNKTEPMILAPGSHVIKIRE